MSEKVTELNPTRKDGGIGEGMGQVHIHIMFDPATGHVQVNGPMQNAILFLGMLKMAEKICDDIRTGRAQPSPNASRIIKPNLQL